jgi:Ca-activated chloride channel homolog
MISFASPWRLALLVTVPLAIAGYRANLTRRAIRTAQLAGQGLVLTAASQRFGHRRHLPFALFVLALAALLIGVARPQMAFGIPRREGTVILAFDVSASMTADDLEPTRLEAAKNAAKGFVSKQPDSIRIGVVAFGDGGFVSLRPTEVRTEVEAAIDRLAPQGGTSLGQGIFNSLSAIAGKPIVVDPAALDSDSDTVDIGYYGSAVVVLLSDGEDNGGPDPLQIAELASVAGVTINTVGIGRAEGTTVSIDGFTVATALNEQLLTDIAEATGGKYYSADHDNGLAEIYDSINLKFVNREQPREVTALFSGFGLLSLLIGSGISLRWFGRVM